MNENFSTLDVFNNLDVAGHAATHPALFAYVKEAMEQPSKQYLLIGDTSHSNRHLHDFLRSPALAALFNHASIPHVAWEAERERIPQANRERFAEQCRLYREGQLTAADLSAAQNAFFTRGMESGRYYWDKPFLGFMQAGLRTTPADSNEWREGTPYDAERVFLGDREVAHYIAEQAHGDKTAVVYGATDTRYNGSLGTRLGREHIVHIDIYADRASYEAQKSVKSLHVDVMPDKVYVLDKKLLENPDPSVYFSAAERLDDPVQSEKEEVARRYGPNANISGNAAQRMERINPSPGADVQWLAFMPG